MIGRERAGQLRQRLLRRLDQVRADIRRELSNHDDETYGQLADRAADAGEQSVVDLLVDLDLAGIDRDVQERREIEAALLRLAGGSYGTRVDCEEPIAPERPEHSPTASRCYDCQQRFERRDRTVHHRTR